MRADVAIITTRADEFEAVLKRFGPNKPQKCSSGRTYGICQVSTRNEKNCIVALVRWVPPLSVVDNSVFSPNCLTLPIDPAYPSC